MADEQKPREVAIDLFEQLIYQCVEQHPTHATRRELAEHLADNFHLEFDYEDFEVRRAMEDHPNKIWRRWLVLKTEKKFIPNETFRNVDEDD